MNYIPFIEAMQYEDYNQWLQRTFDYFDLPHLLIETDYPGAEGAWSIGDEFLLTYIQTDTGEIKWYLYTLDEEGEPQGPLESPHLPFLISMATGAAVGILIRSLKERAREIYITRLRQSLPPHELNGPLFY
jgi:hypothetical protein